MTQRDQEIELLFDKFLEKLKEIPDAENRFKKDGIIDEILFDKEELKVLFIGKEGNDNDKIENKDKRGDYRNWWKEDKIEGIFSHRLSTWAYGILENFPDLDSITEEKKMNALKRIAFINLKKIGGTSTSSFQEMKHHILLTHSELIEQINMINPDVIIGGVTWVSSWKILFGKENIERIDKWILNWNGKFIIDYYHPSARKSNEELYSLLKGIVQKIKS